MKRSEINAIFREASACFAQHGWHLPPQPKWDITDFGLGDFPAYGLVLVNLAEEPEYCEKIMVARRNQRTPAHAHLRKKEDIICREGRLALRLWAGHPERDPAPRLQARVNGAYRELATGDLLELHPGERITLVPGVYHEFYATSEECLIGEVSTANDDLHDNFFVNPEIGRYPGVEEDEAALVRLLSDR